MHEMGVLLNAVKTVAGQAAKHNIDIIRHVTLQIGDLSGYVPSYLQKYFVVAKDFFPVIRQAELIIERIPDSKCFIIKDFGY